MMARVFGTFVLLIFSLVGLGQKEWSNWYLSGNGLLTFKNNNLAALENNFVPGAPPSGFNYYYVNNAAASFSDPVTGQMRFLVSGLTAYDKNFNAIYAPENVRTCPGDKYGLHIIPFQNNPDKFYIVQFQSVSADLVAAETGLQVRCPNAIGLGYSVLDLSQNNGLGKFVSQNNRLQFTTSEGIALVRHANGKDTWVIVHGNNDNKYSAYLFSDAGVSTPVVSSIGPMVQITGAGAGSGVLVASHDGKTLAARMVTNKFLELYDFNNLDGKLSNYRPVNTNLSGSLLTFSPDDSKLYFAENSTVKGILQLDLNKTDILGSMTLVVEDPLSYIYDMQLGLDGKIYMSRTYFLNEDKTYLGVIRCPNLEKYACNYDPKGLEIKYGAGLFPVFVNDYIKQPKATPAKEFSIGNDTLVCFGQIKLSAPVGWQHYRWNTGETTRQIDVRKPGVYYVLAGDEGFSCPTAFGSIRIKNAAEQVNLGKDTTLCPQTRFILNVPENYKSLLWSDGSHDAIKEIKTGGTYSLIAQDENGCTTWDTVNVGFRSAPIANFGNDTTLCSNQSLLLQLLPRPNPFDKTGVYLWQNGSKADSFRVNQPGKFWGRVTYQGCTATDTIQVSYLNSQTANLGADTSFCFGDSLILKTASISGNFIWSTGETSAGITVKNTGRYWVRVNNGSCIATDTINVNNRNRPNLFLGNDTTLCNNQLFRLSAENPGASYLWQDGSTKSSLDITSPGLYALKITQNGCSSTDTIAINYSTTSFLNLGNDTGICVEQTLQLNAENPLLKTYLWQDGSTSAHFLVEKSGTYSVTVVGNDGCLNNDTIKVLVNPAPAFDLGNDTTLCEQQKLPINLSLTNALYTWSNGGTSNSYIADKPGVVWVAVNQKGCVKQDSIMIRYQVLPVVKLGDDTILCQGITKLLNVNNIGASYQWQDMSSQPTLLVTKAGLYHVAVSVNGCIKKDSVLVKYKSIPKFSLGRDTTLCTGDELVLNPHLANVSFLWQNGSVQSTYKVQNAGYYRVTALNECGAYTDSIFISKGLCNLSMPNAFSPNNDGSNDLFRVRNPAFIKTFNMTIFNRWGQIVFITDNAAYGWDGKFRGREQPAGSFIWFVKLITREGDMIETKGSVMLVR